MVDADRKGMEKTSSGEVIISNDGATITNKMEDLQPAAKMLVELSKSQDSVAGDGITTDVETARALLKQCQTLLMSGSHPTVISDSLHKAASKAVDILTAKGVPVELADRDSLIKSTTSLAPLAEDAVLSDIDPAEPEIDQSSFTI